MSAYYDATYSRLSPCTQREDDPCPMEGCEGSLEHDRYGAVCTICGYEWSVDLDTKNE